MNIRKATINDLKRIQELNLMLFEKEAKEFNDPLNTDWTFSDKGTSYYTERIKSKEYIALVAEDKDMIVGYLVGGKCETYEYRNINSMAELENMLILEEYRRKGVGTKLVKEFIGWCKENNISRAHVVASAGNQEAIRFYKRNGFEEYSLDLEMTLNKIK